MKKKKSFTLFDKLKKKDPNKFSSNPSEHLDDLTQGYVLLLSRFDYKGGIESHYEESQRLLSEIDYKKMDLEEFSETYDSLRCEDPLRRDRDGNFFCAYISAAANKLFEEESVQEIKLITGKPGEYPVGLGMFQKKGRLIIIGECSSTLGYRKSGGILDFNGRAGNFVGNTMSGGSIIIKGQLGMISEYINGGKIYYNDIKIWPR